jgi:hypothetical protein
MTSLHTYAFASVAQDVADVIGLVNVKPFVHEVGLHPAEPEVIALVRVVANERAEVRDEDVPVPESCSTIWVSQMAWRLVLAPL